MQSVIAPNLKAGQVVHMHGGEFAIMEDAYIVRERDGEPPVYVAAGYCLSGEVRGYFKPGSVWSFQGNLYASWAVES